MNIINNITNTLKDDLSVEIKKGSKISIAAACFSIYAFQELKKQLTSIDELRFIFTSPTFTTISEIDPLSGTVTFLNGVTIKTGDVTGDVSEKDMRRIQIREVKDNPLNDNFAKKEFQALWKEINHKYAYTVDFDSNELIRNSIYHINKDLMVSELRYTTTVGSQKAEISSYDLDNGDSFANVITRTHTLKHTEISDIRYDLIGKIAEGTTLTRKTVSKILQGIRIDKLYMFRNNPEEFLITITELINEQKATAIVDHISYDTIAGEYDNNIFTAEKSSQSFEKAFLAKKAIQDYVFTDGTATESVEKKFVKELDAAEEVCVYAKLPRTFHIPTPLGNYSPDWAIAFYEGTVKHIFFIAETKGSMKNIELKPIEKAKIDCAEVLFNKMSSSQRQRKFL